jgi:hypothetical protein
MIFVSNQRFIIFCRHPRALICCRAMTSPCFRRCPDTSYLNALSTHLSNSVGDYILIRWANNLCYNFILPEWQLMQQQLLEIQNREKLVKNVSSASEWTHREYAVVSCCIMEIDPGSISPSIPL